MAFLALSVQPNWNVFPTRGVGWSINGGLPVLLCIPSKFFFAYGKHILGTQLVPLLTDSYLI